MSIAEKLVTIAENEHKVYDAGKQAEWDAFWDNYQDHGNRIYYSYAFAYNWNDAIYNPKYSINSEALSYGFYLSKITDTKVDIIVRGDITGTFQQCTALKTIQKLIVTEAVKYSATFNKCTALENITFEGVIGQDINFKDCAKLTPKSLMSIINALKPLKQVVETEVEYREYTTTYPPTEAGVFYIETWYKILRFEDDYHNVIVLGENETQPFVTLNMMEIPQEIRDAKEIYVYPDTSFKVRIVAENTTGETKTLTIGDTNLAKLTAEEKAIATNKGWNVV